MRGETLVEGVRRANEGDVCLGSEVCEGGVRR